VKVGGAIGVPVGKKSGNPHPPSLEAAEFMRQRCIDSVKAACDRRITKPSGRGRSRSGAGQVHEPTGPTLPERG
jgi:hypothetical protein